MKKSTVENKELLSYEVVEKRIYLIRRHKIMLDRDLAELYGVDTRQLNQAVKRNSDRFPEDFMFSLTREEIKRISQTVISLKYSKNVNVFTEQGVSMLSSVLKSKRAVQVNIAIMRTFVKIREILSNNKELSIKIDTLENKFAEHDVKIKAVFDAIRQLMRSSEKPKSKIGFKPKNEKH